jgi:hypothetical protein
MVLGVKLSVVIFGCIESFTFHLDATRHGAVGYLPMEASVVELEYSLETDVRLIRLVE